MLGEAPFHSPITPSYRTTILSTFNALCPLYLELEFDPRVCIRTFSTSMGFDAAIAMVVHMKPLSSLTKKVAGLSPHNERFTLSLTRE